MTLYSEDFRTLLKNSWINGTVIDALLLTYVTNEIDYITVKVSNSIWSSTKVQIAKSDWFKYCVLFLPEGNHWSYLLWTSFWIACFT